MRLILKFSPADNNGHRKVTATMEPTLKPCPFCGSKDVYLEDASDEHGELWVIGCKNCFIGISAGGGDDGCCDATKEETIKAWNRRAHDGRKTDTV